MIIAALGGGHALLAADESPGAAEVASPDAAADREFFEKQVRPLLVARCHECHAGEKVKGNLHLDSREGALAGGDTGPAILPGKPDESLLVDAIRYGETYRMPPKGQLPAADIATLIEWVRRGAPWPKDAAAAPQQGGERGAFDFELRARHWCFQPLARAAPPSVAAATWPRNPIDRFILKRLEEAHLAPAPPCDPRTLLRRVTYDLIGLPPTPAEIAAFLADESPDAYEKVVDRLLASPHYGERMARHWLDLARFAETYGHEHDFEIPNAWPYRDYLIRAFNADVPYDRLVVEHLAGDLVEQPRRHPQERFNESIIGTAFFFLGEARHSPVDVRQDGADRVDNQIDVLSKTFLALTVGCARCHDHKFDAIKQSDYYALAGYLRSSRYQQAFLDDPADSAPLIAQLEELRRHQRAAVARYVEAVIAPRARRSAADLLAAARGGNDGAKERLARAAAQPDDVLHAFAVLASLPPTATGDDFFKRRAELVDRLSEQAQAAADGKPESLADFSGGTYGDWSATGAAFGPRPAAADEMCQAAGDANKEGCAITFTLPGATAAHSGILADKLQGVLRSPTFTIARPKIFYRLWGTGGRLRLVVDGLQLIRDPIYGGLDFAPRGTPPYWHEQDVSKWIGHRAYIEVVDDGDGYIALDRAVMAERPPPDGVNRLVLKRLAEPAIASLEALAAAYQELFVDAAARFVAGTLNEDDLGADRVRLVNLLFSDELRGETIRDEAATKASADCRADLAAVKVKRDALCANLPAPRRALAMAEGTPENELLFIRGNHKTPGDEVPRRPLAVFAGEAHPAPADGSGRLELARGLVDGSNPLVPRVIVNRLWQHRFGRGIVPTADDFGAMGQPPSQPELLDWLAAEFIEHGWSMKSLDRLMVLSSTYRMSGAASADAIAADPTNRLLHHMPRRRLDAESIRDAVLAVSGRLDRAMFGPGVPPHLTPFMSGRGRPKESGPLDGAGRRSIYINVRRNFLTPMLLAFDYPTPFTTIGRRSTSNVPAQALTMLNNPFVAEQAAVWARRVLAGGQSTDAERAAAMYVEAFGRSPDAAETAAVAVFLAEQRARYATAHEQQAWTDLAHVLFNAKEFIFIE